MTEDEPQHDFNFQRFLNLPILIKRILTKETVY